MATAGKLLRSSCCRQRAHSLQRQLITQIRCMSNTGIAAQSQKGEHTLPRKKKDRNAVLKVLSSTVKQLQDRPPFGFSDDPFLMPRSLLRKKEYLKVMESGRQAAMYVLKNYPDLTRLRQPVPDFQQRTEVFEEKENEETLNYYIDNDKLKESVQLYERLRANGEKLSLLTLNRVLDLVGFHGVGNDLITFQKPVVSNMDEGETVLDEAREESSSSSSDSESSSDEEENGNDQKPEESPKVTVEKQSGKSVWRDDNYAETMFHEMQERNGSTYEALILALLKFDETTRAFEFYEAMLNQGYQGSAFMYSSLMAKLSAMVLPKQEKWARAETLLHNMKKSPAVHPDLGVFNNLLELSYVMGQQAPALASSILNEMIAVGVEPSLASYLFMIKIYSSRGQYNPGLLLSVIRRLKGQTLSIQHERDPDFFGVAMAVAKENYDVESVKELYNLAFSPGNEKFWKHHSREFLANYLNALALAETDVDFVFQEYNRLVPGVFTPREWIYDDLFKRIKQENQLWRIPQLYNAETIFEVCGGMYGVEATHMVWSQTLRAYGFRSQIWTRPFPIIMADIKAGNIYLGVGLIKSLLRALGRDIPQDKAEDLLFVVEDLHQTLQGSEFESLPMLLDRRVKLYAVNGKFEIAREAVQSSAERDIYPSKATMFQLLSACVERRDIDNTMATIEYMVKLKQSPDIQDINKISLELDLSDNQREYLKSLIE